MAEQSSSLKDSKTVEVALAPKAIKRKNTSPPELQTPSKRTTEQASSQRERLEDVFQDEIIKAFADITSFKQFARSENGLCLDQSYIKIIVEDHSNVEEQKLELLFKWREIKGEKATVPKIRHLLQKYFRSDNPSDYIVLENGIFGVYTSRFLCKRSKVYVGVQMSEYHDTQIRAIKFIRKKKKSLREAQVLVKLGNHVNVVSIIHAGIHHADPYDYMYIAMQLQWIKTVRNMLEDSIKLGKPFHEFIAWSLVEQLMRAVEFLHSHNIIHCDLKTDNVLASDDWRRFKVTGFGSSKETSDDSATIQTNATTDSEGYRSPETYNLSAKITTKADIFSAGIMIAEIMANGKHPFGEDPDLWRYNIKNNKKLDLSHIHVFNKDQVIGLIKQLLEMDPKKRSTAKEVLNDVSSHFQTFQLRNQQTTAGRPLATTSKEDRLEDVFQDEIICAIADITAFKRFARGKSGLCLDEGVIQDIVENHKDKVEEQKMELLNMWKENQGVDATIPKVRSLLQKFMNLREVNSDDRIVDVFQDEIIRAFVKFAGFRKFARSSHGLCLDELDLQNIVKDENDVEEQKMQMLFQWKKNNQDQASVSKIRSLLQSYRDREKVFQEGRVVDVFQDKIIKAFSNIAGFMKFARSRYGLCLDELDLQNIVEKHENNVEEQKMKMLFQWKTNIGDQAASVSKIRSLLQSYLARDSQEDEIRGQVAIGGQTSPKKSKFEWEDSGDSALSRKSPGVGDAAGTSNSAAREVTVNTAVPNDQTTRVADSNSDSVDVRLSGGTQPAIQGGRYDQGLSSKYLLLNSSEECSSEEEYNGEEYNGLDYYGKKYNDEEYSDEESSDEESSDEEYNREDDDFGY